MDIDVIEITSPGVDIEEISPTEEPLEIIVEEPWIEVLQPPAVYLDIVLDPQVEEIEIVGGYVFGGGGSGGGGTIQPTTNLLRGDNAGNAMDSGIPSANVVVKNPLYATPTTINQVIACLQAAGLCA